MSRLSRTSDGYVYTLEGVDVQLEFRGLRRTGGGVYSGLWADVVCTFGSERRDIHEARYNLSSSSQRASLVKFLSSRIELPAAEGADDWTGIVEAACVGVLRSWRQGRTPANLGEGEEPSDTTYRIDPVLEDGQLTMIYGDKATGKSELALAMAYAVADGVAVLGLPVMSGPTFYLDWETDQRSQRRRLWHLARGLSAPQLPTIHYFEMTRSLPDEIDGIERRVEQQGGAALVVIDSLVPACGGNAKEPDAATAFWHAVRALKTTVLCIAQTQKPTPGERRQQSRSIFGSGLFEYAARNIWRIRASQEPGSDLLDIGLFHEKCNNGPLRKPLGWRLIFDNEARSTTLRPQEPKAVAAFSDALPVKDQIVLLLEAGSRSLPDIAAELVQKEDTIRRTLNRYRDKLFVYLEGEGRWGNRSYQDT